MDQALVAHEKIRDDTKKQADQYTRMPRGQPNPKRNLSLPESRWPKVESPDHFVTAGRRTTLQAPSDQGRLRDRAGFTQALLL